MPKSRGRKKKPKPQPTEMSPQMRDALLEQRAAFRAKFGRDPGPSDPIFFDLESKPGDLGHALALIQASRIAGLKRTVWQTDSEPYGTFLEASVEETSRPSVRSEVERELRQRTYGKSYIVMELDRVQAYYAVIVLGLFSIGLVNIITGLVP